MPLALLTPLRTTCRSATARRSITTSSSLRSAAKARRLTTRLNRSTSPSSPSSSDYRHLIPPLPSLSDSCRWMSSLPGYSVHRLSLLTSSSRIGRKNSATSGLLLSSINRLRSSRGTRVIRRILCGACLPIDERPGRATRPLLPASASSKAARPCQPVRRGSVGV